VSTRAKALGAIAATIGLLLGGTACGDSTSGSATALEMWTFKQTHVKPLQDAAAEFKKQTGITVNITAYTPDDTYKSKIQTSAQTRNLPDVLEVHAAGEDFVLGGSGILADLAPNVDAAWKAGFVKGTADAALVTDARYQRSLQPKSAEAGIKTGQYFSVPFTIGTFGVVYANKKKLADAGLDPAKPPKTWADFVAWLKAVHDKDPADGGLTVGMKSPTTGFNWGLEPLSFAYLGAQGYRDLFGKDPAKSFGSPAGLAVLELYDQLTPYWKPGTQTLGIDDADRAFAQGKAGFDLGGTFTLASLRQNGMNPADVVTFGIPAASGGATSDLKLAPIALTGLAVSAQAKNPEAALKWLQFLSTPERAGAFAQASLDLPGTELGADAERLLGPELAAVRNVFGDATAGAYDPTDTTVFSPAYDDKSPGETLIRMSPLHELTPEQENQALGGIVATSWK